MNKYVVFVVIFVLAISCKTAKKAAHQPAVDVEPVVEQVIEKIEEPAPVEYVPADDKPVVMRTEEVKVYEDEKEKTATFDYYVVIGSFSKAENASKSKAEMQQKGFEPVVLTTDSGLYRVAVDQTNSENEARAFIKHIRSQFPEHNDVWLLKKK